jgi:hypothetical protein
MQNAKCKLERSVNPALRECKLGLYLLIETGGNIKSAVLNFYFFKLFN